jgi:hypothetical protein
MPAPYKPFEAFQRDQTLWMSYTNQQVRAQVQQTNEGTLGIAALGTLVGAGVGAAACGGRGAAIGAASGVVSRDSCCWSHGHKTQYFVQQRYNIAYSQCMHARGDQVPGFASPTVPPPPPSLGR